MESRKGIFPEKLKRGLFLLRYISCLMGMLLVLSSCFSKSDYDIYCDYPLPKGPIEELDYTSARSKFSLWSPEADEVRLLLYSSANEGHADKMVSLELDEDTGVWSVELSGDQANKYYTFNVKQEGKWLGDTPGLQAKAVGVNGQRAIITSLKESDPEGWGSDILPRFNNYTDAIIYQLHHRDFSISSSSGVSGDVKGKFLALAADSTNNDLGHATGLSHLKELGVTHVRLMPSFDFAGIDETWLDEQAYCWGYSPQNHWVPEGSYSTDPSNPMARIKEFKEMVLALHKAGIRVVMDVSYAYQSDSRAAYFDRVVPGYFYRQDKSNRYIETAKGDFEIATERPFVQQFILASLCHWVREYHIDGFYFDELSLYNSETLEYIEKELKLLKPSILLLGGDSNYSPSTLPNVEGIAQLSSTLAIGLRSYPNDTVSNSFLLGDSDFSHTVQLGITAGTANKKELTDSIPDQYEFIYTNPALSLNYLSTHEGFLLYDYLKRNALQLSYNNELIRLSKLAYTALFTSQGIPSLFAGEEFLHSKHGYLSSEVYGDSINSINWSKKSFNDDHFNYVKRLIQLRKAHPAFRITSAAAIERHLEFLPELPKGVVAYRLKNNANGDEWEDIVVILNGSKQPVRINIPEGRYIVVCRDGYINELGLSYAYGALYVNPQSASILYRTDKQVYIPVEEPVEEESEEEQEREILIDDKIELKLQPTKAIQHSLPTTIEKIE